MKTRVAMSAVRGRAALVDHPLFWSVACVIFLANAVLSVVHGQWVLVALQGLTAGLAAVSALTATSRRATTGSESTISSGSHHPQAGRMRTRRPK
jgi:hypothetical protein